MTDLHPLSLASQQSSLLAKRYARDRRFRLYGAVAIAVAFLFLAMLLISVIGSGIGAFHQTAIRIPIAFDAAVIDPSGARDPAMLARANYAALVQQGLRGLFPGVTSHQEKRLLYSLISDAAAYEVQQEVLKDSSWIGKAAELWLPASAGIDMLAKGNVSREVPEQMRRIKNEQLRWFETLEQSDRIRQRFNFYFLTRGDSRTPEQAGILSSLVGSLSVILVCLAIAFSIGVGAAVYLEEFAPENKLTGFIEVNINNLAAVPSIVFGLLALAIFLNGFGVPRSSALAGGFALSLLVLPTIVITTRNALKAVPPSIRDAARALGASPVQVLFHHTLPCALPGVMTGAILSTARALGETAPLLMIGMVAFVADIPGGFLEPATVLPVQIYLWADSPEQAFMEKTSGAIMVLLIVLALLNALAVFLRRKFEYTW